MRHGFDRLTESFRDVPAKAGDSATSILDLWQAKHAPEIVARRPDAEFNGTMMQGFHWYSVDDGQHWNRLRDQAPALAKAGISAIWFPPATKGMAGIRDVGYGVYDLFDLGEFPQGKGGSVRTRYGTKQEYLAAVNACRDAGMQVYADVVFNHKMGAEFEEEFEAIPCDPHNRNHHLGGPRLIRSWTGFDFPARNNTHSTMKWRWWHFGAVDYNSWDPGFHAIWRKKDKPFSDEADLENGNYDYLMGCDLDVDHPEVRGELKHWGRWMLDTAPISGFRLDAIKHIEGGFFNEWLDEMEIHAGHDLFCVGEYWTPRLDTLSWYIGKTGGRMHLFDAPLQGNFHRASKAGGAYDMRTILDGSLMKHFPLFAVTLVENHDTQPLQSLEAVVEAWFKPLAYAIILLRAEGYPCIFQADYFGASYRGKGRDGVEYGITLASHHWLLNRFLFARCRFAHGPQKDYLDHFNTIGWTRLGTAQHPHALAVLLSDGPAGSKWMDAGRANKDFVDITGHMPGMLRTNEHGWAEFRCRGGSVSIWVEWHAGLDADLPG